MLRPGLELAFASRMTASAGDFGRILVLFAIRAAVLFVRHAGTGWVRAFFLICHGISSEGMLPFFCWMPARRYARGSMNPRFTGGCVRTCALYLALSQVDASNRIMIRKLKSGEYRIYSRSVDKKTGKRRNLGTFSTRQAAEKHERAIQYFKHS